VRSFRLSKGFQSDTAYVDFYLNAGTSTISITDADSNSSVRIDNLTLISFPKVFDLTQAIPTSNAVIDKYFLTVGGNDNDGAGLVTANAPSSGTYRLTIAYSTFSYRTSNNWITVAIDSVYGQRYNVPVAKFVSRYDIQIYLSAGDHVIKFQGPNDELYAGIYLDYYELALIKADPPPVVTPPTPPPTPPTITAPTTPLPLDIYDAARGTLNGGSKLESSDTNLILAGYIGGSSDGSTTIKVNANTSGNYKLSLLYISGDGPRPFAIDVNNSNIGTFTSEKTDGYKIANLKNFTTKINLNAGENTIKLHGNGKDYGPSFSLLSVLPYGVYHAINGILSGEAILDMQYFVAGFIGGKTDGASTITINVNSSGKYTLALEYVSGNNRPFKLDVNGTTLGTYNLTATNGVTFNDSNFFTVVANLNSGNNTLKIHGDGT
ncbi:MAG: hypothetical protein ACRC7R_09675, partial [Sarcina sp.]